VTTLQIKSNSLTSHPLSQYGYIIQHMVFLMNTPCRPIQHISQQPASLIMPAIYKL